MRLVHYVRIKWLIFAGITVLSVHNYVNVHDVRQGSVAWVWVWVWEGGGMQGSG